MSQSEMSEYGFQPDRGAILQFKNVLPTWVDEGYMMKIKRFLVTLSESHLEVEKTTFRQEKGGVIQDEIKARFPQIFNVGVTSSPNSPSTNAEISFITRKRLFIALRVVYQYHKARRAVYLRKLKMGGHGRARRVEIRSGRGVTGIKTGAPGTKVGPKRKRMRSAKAKAIVNIKKCMSGYRHFPTARVSSSTSDDEFVDSEHDAASMDEDENDLGEDNEDVETGSMQVDKAAAPSHGRGRRKGFVDTGKIGPPIRTQPRPFPMTDLPQTRRQPTLPQSKQFCPRPSETYLLDLTLSEGETDERAEETAIVPGTAREGESEFSLFRKGLIEKENAGDIRHRGPEPRKIHNACPPSLPPIPHPCVLSEKDDERPELHRAGKEMAVPAFQSPNSPFFGYSSRTPYGSSSAGSASIPSQASSAAQGPRRDMSSVDNNGKSASASNRGPEPKLSTFPGSSECSARTPAPAPSPAPAVEPLSSLSNKFTNVNNIERSPSPEASLVSHRYRRGYSYDRFRKSIEAQSQSQSQGKSYHDGRSNKENEVLSMEMPPSNQLVLQEQQYRRRLGQDVAPKLGFVQVAQRLPPPIPLSSHPLHASYHHPPYLSASASPTPRATPAVVNTPIHTFLASCTPSMAHLAPLFIRFGCDTEELVLSVGMWERERIKVFLEDVQQSSADDMNGEGESSWREGSVEGERTRGMTRMEMMIIQNHWETYFR